MYKKLPSLFRKVSASIALLGVLFLNSQIFIAHAETLPSTEIFTVYSGAVKDSYVDQNATTTNFGNFQSFDVKSNITKNRRALVQYDLSFLNSGQEIQSAQMYVYMHNDVLNRTYGAFQVLDTWVEGNGGTNNNPVDEVRWDNKPSASTTQTSTTLMTPGAKWVAFDVTEDVKNIAQGSTLNNGWMIQDMTEDSTTDFLSEFYSKETASTTCIQFESTSPVGCKPYIKVVYTLPAEEVLPGSVKVILNTSPASTTDAFNVMLTQGETITASHLFAGSGEYTFDTVTSGAYSFVHLLPPGWASLGAVCMSGETDLGTDFSIASGEHIVCTIGSIKHSSLTVTNYAEPIQGTYSFTLSSTSELGETMVFDPVTLGNGESHTFSDITPGTYNLLEIVDGAPVGETAVCFIGDTIVDPRLTSIVIPPGVDIQCTYNHGEFAVVQGNVFEDMNANALQDEGDSSLSGWNVKLFKVTEQVVEEIIPATEEGGEDTISTSTISVISEVGSQVTTASGYVFGELSPGTYKVCEEIQPGWLQSYPVAGEDCGGSLGHMFTLVFGEVATKHFGNSHIVVPDTTAPVSTFTSPLSGSSIEDDFMGITGSTTDEHGVASTTLAFAVYTGAGETGSCGVYTPLTSLIHTDNSNVFNWTYNWTPEDGVYCLTAHGQDVAGNTEASPIVTNITFKKKVVVTPPADTGGGNGGGGGTGGGGGGNGPIAGSFGGNSGGGNGGGTPTALAFGGNPGGEVVPESTPTPTPALDTQTENKKIAVINEDETDGIPSNGAVLTDASSASTTVDTLSEPVETDTSNLAAVGALRWNNWYWLWLLIVLAIIGGVYYSTRDRNK